MMNRMTWLLVAGMLLSTGLLAGDNAKKATAYFVVKGMTCENCEVKIKKNLLHQEGVIKVDASHKAGMVRVIYNPSEVENTESLVAAIDAAGFTARPVSSRIGERRWKTALSPSRKKHCDAGKAKKSCCAASGKKKGCATKKSSCATKSQ